MSDTVETTFVVEDSNDPEITEYKEMKDNNTNNTSNVDSEEYIPSYIKFNRKPYPHEILSNDELHHPLNKYPDIKSRLIKIRAFYMEAAIFLAEKAMQETEQYIIQNYSPINIENISNINSNNNSNISSKDINNSVILQSFYNHPSILKLIQSLKETRKMLEYLLSQEEKWKLFKDDGTWKTEYAVEENSDYLSYRLTGIGDIPIFNIIAVINEMDLLYTWLPLAKETRELGQLSLSCKCGIIRIGLFWPFQDRECILYAYGVDDTQNGRVMIYFDSRENVPNVEIPKCPANRCRVELFLGGIYFERLGENRTKIVVVWNADPQVTAPTALINWFAGSFAGMLLSQMVDAAKFDNDSEYHARIQNNPEFYGKMKERLLAAQNFNANVDHKGGDGNIVENAKLKKNK